MTIEEFLTKHVEGYLFCDLEKMAEISLKPPETCGAAGYPMVATTLTGMELLGGILSTSPFDTHKGNEYFVSYWENYLSESCARYKVQGLAPLFRNLVRHGLAHTFTAKIGILVTKGDSANHLRIDAQRQELWIDALEFLKDFRQSYFDLVKPIVLEQFANSQTAKHSMQNRLDEMLDVYSQDSTRLFAKLTPQPPTAPSPFPMSSVSTTFPRTYTTPSGVGHTP